MKNGVGVYAGLLDGNIHFERLIVGRPKAAYALRAGVGFASSLSFEGSYINLAAIYLSGKNASHIELNAGARYFPGGSLQGHESPHAFVLPDVFVGYRHEKPHGRAFFRLGVSVTTLLNIGLGMKFQGPTKRNGKRSIA